MCMWIEYKLGRLNRVWYILCAFIKIRSNTSKDLHQLAKTTSTSDSYSEHIQVQEEVPATNDK